MANINNAPQAKQPGLLNVLVSANPVYRPPEFCFLPGYIKNIPYKYSEQNQSTITNSLSTIKKVTTSGYFKASDSVIQVDSVLDKTLTIKAGQSGLGVHLSFLDNNIETVIEHPEDPNKVRTTTFINL